MRASRRSAAHLQYTALVPLVLCTLLLAGPALLQTIPTLQAIPYVNRTYDRCLASVRARTSPSTTIRLAGAPTSIKYIRATYMLWPRRVVLSGPASVVVRWDGSTCQVTR
jgi:hypothetical protein